MYTLSTALFALAAGAFAAPTHPEPSTTASTVASTTTSAPPPPAATPDKALFQDLFTSPSALGRFQRLLTNPSTGGLLPPDQLLPNIVFDYNANAGPSAGGKIAAAVAATFPILVEQDISTVTAFLNPCSLLVPHTHPQPESLVVAQGTLMTGTLIPGLVAPGQGTGEIVQTLSQYQGTVFPAGAIHYQVNTNCEPAVFISSLPTSDPGTTLESTFFSLSGDIIQATLGIPDKALNGKDLDTFRDQIPAGVILALETCVATCGL